MHGTRQETGGTQRATHRYFAVVRLTANSAGGGGGRCCRRPGRLSCHCRPPARRLPFAATGRSCTGLALPRRVFGHEPASVAARQQEARASIDGRTPHRNMGAAAPASCRKARAVRCQYKRVAVARNLCRTDMKPSRALKSDKWCDEPRAARRTICCAAGP